MFQGHFSLWSAVLPNLHPDRLPSSFGDSAERGRQLGELRVGLHRGDAGRRRCRRCCSRRRRLLVVVADGGRRHRRARTGQRGWRGRGHVVRRAVVVAEQRRGARYIVERGDGGRRRRRPAVVVGRVGGMVVVRSGQVRVARRRVMRRTLRSTLRVRVHRAYVIWFQFAELLVLGCVLKVHSLRRYSPGGEGEMVSERVCFRCEVASLQHSRATLAL